MGRPRPLLRRRRRGHAAHPDRPGPAQAGPQGRGRTPPARPRRHRAGPGGGGRRPPARAGRGPPAARGGGPAQGRAGQATVLRRPHRRAGRRRAGRLDLHRREGLGVRPQLAPGGDRPRVRPPALTGRKNHYGSDPGFSHWALDGPRRPTVEAPMTAPRHNDEEIFHAARDIADPQRRPEYVREACGGDEARVAHIEALLAAADVPDSLLDRPAGSGPVATIDQAATESPGTVIGPCRLIQEIGAGGMGTVWMAQQTDPVKRLVAVKLIKAGMDSRQVIARFEAERQALALMDHPNIARVFDGGTTPGGLPYFVMELVRGVPIT